jgi:hypothetical protein
MYTQRTESGRSRLEQSLDQHLVIGSSQTEMRADQRDDRIEDRLLAKPSGVEPKGGHMRLRIPVRIVELEAGPILEVSPTKILADLLEITLRIHPPPLLQSASCRLVEIAVQLEGERWSLHSFRPQFIDDPADAATFAGDLLVFPHRLLHEALDRLVVLRMLHEKCAVCCRIEHRQHRETMFLVERTGRFEVTRWADQPSNSFGDGRLAGRAIAVESEHECPVGRQFKTRLQHENAPLPDGELMVTVNPL